MAFKIIYAVGSKIRYSQSSRIYIKYTFIQQTWSGASAIINTIP